MIGVRIEGRLGNQMFQYAFAYNAAKKLNTDFYIDKSIEKYKLYDYFYVKREIFSFLDKSIFSLSGFKLFFCHYSRMWFYNFIGSNIFKNKKPIQENELKQENGAYKFENNRIYHGFFQSEKFFLENIDSVKSHFSISEKLKDSYHTRFKNLQEKGKIATVHIRKTDYQTLEHLDLGGSDLSLPFSYYHNLIKKINNLGNVFFVFISDDTSVVENEFSYLTNKIISHDDEITDFQHMLNADICILANSTFSWWAAYLNNNKNKIVYAPKYFLGWKVKQEFPSDIYPNNWQQIVVE